MNLKCLISVVKNYLALNTRNSQLIREILKEVPSELHHIKKSFFKYEKRIQLAFSKKYSNIKLENLHKHIKILKRLSYGYRVVSAP
ncbi:transposase [Enterococcus faecium]|uniref:transposase n=1 Tax=Enterococcus faecium TaxID=1352 RepID=UPI0038413746|nr:transposase [Enterococcus faecium]